MPRRIAAAFLFLLTAAAAHADWLSYDEAIEKARQEQKPILLYLRVNCDRCNRDADQLLAEAEKHEPITLSYQPFVRARIDAMSKAPQSLRAQKAPAPALLVLEPSGTYVTAWTDWNASRYLNFLRLTRAQAKAIVDASRLREHDSGEAEIADANVAIDTLMFDRARQHFDSARDEFRKQGKGEREELAEMGSAFAAFLGGERRHSLNDLTRAVQASKSSHNRAYGYGNLGTMNLILRDRAAAATAYREALAAAAPGSPEAEEAQNELIALGVAKPAPDGRALLQIVPPPRTTITGRADFSATALPDIKRVAWFIDGAPAASSDRAPFDARLDLGITPRQHTITAIGFNGSGEAIAEAVASVNDRLDFRVTLVSPVGGDVSGKTLVEASVATPPDHAIKSVDLFWNERKLGTFDAPPYRAEANVPREFGYFRALATLDDGRTAEDTRVVNSPAVGETVDVHAVAFAATVKDRNGRRIDGLSASDFKATDAGAPVQLKVRDEDEPVTIGVAIDSSASMRDLLLPAIETAWQFIDTVVSPRDRVFFVAFDSRPHLIASPTSDRAALENAVFDIIPAGQTAVVDAIAFSLQQFTGLTGKKALVLITDGREGGSSQTAAAATRMANESGVPIYLFVPRGGVDITPAGGGLDPTLSSRAEQLELEHRRIPGSFGGTTAAASRVTVVAGPNSPLAGIAMASGGNVFFAPRPADQAAIFERIRDEVRGQYLLSFISSAPKAGEWREVRVGVNRSNATVRTIAGYYAR